MKKLILILFAMFLSFGIYAQNADKELVVGLPKLSEKNIFLLENVKYLEGIKYVDYCPGHKLLLIEYNTKVYADENQVLKILEASLKMPVYIKVGEFKDVRELCDK